MAARCPVVAGPGQYVLVNLPALGLWDWHPFSASAHVDGGLIFHIKSHPKPANAIGCGGWTGRLASLAQSLEHQDMALPVVRLRGPYGHMPYEDYDYLLLFAGGIGVTPMMRLLVDLHRRARAGQLLRAKQVVLVWVVPSASLLDLFPDVYASLAAPPQRGATPTTFLLQIYVTRGPLPASPVPGLELLQGRCDVSAMFASFSVTRQTLAAVCGPETLVQAVSAAASLFACDFHSELFYF